ncbi:MAG: HPr-rel-A system PqqD family peptide chaperone [Pseudomonadota bacterium]
MRHHRWGNESVVYNDLTGDTHLLDDDTMAVLHALRGEARSLDSLCLALGAAGDTAALAELLDGLARLALVKSPA